MEQCITYIDEAGHTGYNIWDFHDQPFFVLAGVTMEEGTLDIAGYVERMFLAHKQPNQTYLLKKLKRTWIEICLIWLKQWFRQESCGQ